MSNDMSLTVNTPRSTHQQVHRRHEAQRKTTYIQSGTPSRCTSSQAHSASRGSTPTRSSSSQAALGQEVALHSIRDHGLNHAQAMLQALATEDFNIEARTPSLDTWEELWMAMCVKLAHSPWHWLRLAALSWAPDFWKHATCEDFAGLCHLRVLLGHELGSDLVAVLNTLAQFVTEAHAATAPFPAGESLGAAVRHVAVQQLDALREGIVAGDAVMELRELRVAVVEALAALRSMPPQNMEENPDLAPKTSMRAKLEEGMYLEVECQRLEAEGACRLFEECEISCQPEPVATSAADTFVANMLDETASYAQSDRETDVTSTKFFQEADLYRDVSVQVFQSELQSDESAQAEPRQDASVQTPKVYLELSEGWLAGSKFERRTTKSRDDLGDRLHDVAMYMRGRIDEIRAARGSAVKSHIWQEV